MNRGFFTRPDVATPSPAARVAIYAALSVWAFICLFPLYWLVVTSVKEPIHVNSGPVYLPFIDYQPSLHAWRYIFFELGRDTLRPYFNSVIVAFLSTGLAIVIGGMAAYALTRIRYRVRLATILLFVVCMLTAFIAIMAEWLGPALAIGSAMAVFIIGTGSIGRRVGGPVVGNDDILFWILSNRILPPVVVVLPIYVMFQKVGLLDTHLALILTYAAANLPIVVWLLRDFFAAIPKDIEEQASIDGASQLRTVFTIVLPLAKPGLAATFLLVFILAWNEYLLSLFLSTSNAQTMPLLVAAQNATRGPQWWYMSVLIVIMIVPVIALTALLQRFIAKGFLVGAVKG
jgi:multiple sugar transport system permease protein